MANKFSAYLYQITNVKTVILFLLLFFITIGVIFPLISNMLGLPEDLESADTAFNYNVDELYEIIETYDPPARKASAVFHFSADLIFPIVYLFSFGTLISFTLSQGLPKSTWLQRANLTPLFLFVFDLLENTGLAILFTRYPTKLLGLARVTSFISVIKWCLSGLSVILVLVGLLGMLLNIFKPIHPKDQTDNQS